MVDASRLPAAVEELDEPREDDVEATVVEFPEDVEESVEVAVVEDRPLLDDGVSVDTVPLDEADVRPDVLCAAVPPLDVPWM